MYRMQKDCYHRNTGDIANHYGHTRNTQCISPCWTFIHDTSVHIHTLVDDGFDFLGWNFRKYKDKLLIKPSRDSIDKITKKIGEVIKGGKAWTQEHPISILNPIIIGWSNYHQPVVSKDIFSNLDNRLWGMLWKWAKRRHPNKSKSWIADKYWYKMRVRKWVFST